jgi:hypothetical protein
MVDCLWFGVLTCPTTPLLFPTLLRFLESFLLPALRLPVSLPICFTGYARLRQERAVRGDGVRPEGRDQAGASGKGGREEPGAGRPDASGRSSNPRQGCQRGTGQRTGFVSCLPSMARLGSRRLTAKDLQLSFFLLSLLFLPPCSCPLTLSFLPVPSFPSLPPGLSSTRIQRVTVVVPFEDDEQPGPKADRIRNSAEHIVVGTIDLEDLYDTLKGLEKRPGYVIGAELSSFADGLQAAKTLIYEESDEL